MESLPPTVAMPGLRLTCYCDIALEFKSLPVPVQRSLSVCKTIDFVTVDNLKQLVLLGSELSRAGRRFPIVGAESTELNFLSGSLSV